MRCEEAEDVRLLDRTREVPGREDGREGEQRASRRGDRDRVAAGGIGGMERARAVQPKTPPVVHAAAAGHGHMDGSPRVAHETPNGSGSLVAPPPPLAAS